MFLLAVGYMAHRSVRLSQKDAKRIKMHADEPVEGFNQEELRESEGKR
jgi:hypothetical protein